MSDVSLMTNVSSTLSHEQTLISLYYLSLLKVNPVFRKNLLGPIRIFTKELQCRQLESTEASCSLLVSYN